MAELKLDELSAAESDCTEAIALDPSYVKAYLRRATAAKQLGKLLAAVEDYEQALRLEPTSKATVADRQTCLDQVLLQEGLQSELPRVAIPIGHEPTLKQPSVSGSTPKGAAAELHEPPSSASGTSTAMPSKAVEQQQAVPALKQGRQEPSGGQKLPDKSAQGPQQQPAPQQDMSGPSSSRQNGHHMPPVAAHAGTVCSAFIFSCLMSHICMCSCLCCCCHACRLLPPPATAAAARRAHCRHRGAPA